MTNEEISEEQRLVEQALAAADDGDAGHWPTVAGILADEVRRLQGTTKVASAKNALDKAIDSLTETRRIKVFVGEADAVEHVGYALWCNDTHLVVNCTDGSRIFYLRSAVILLTETPR